MLISRLAIFAPLLLGAALFLTACPRPNGYEAVPATRLALPQAVGMYAIPGLGQEVVVPTKDGRIYRTDLADPNASAPSIYLDLTGRVIDNPADEEGLLGLAFAPDYAESGNVYVNYTAGNPRRNIISRFTAPGRTAADPGSEQVLLAIEQPFDNHNGGALAFGPDGMLYIASGDGGSSGDPMGNGQRLDTLLGKILRIDVSGGAAYTIPPDNPFATGGGRPEIWAWGLRNPWRLTFDRETGALWTADVGEQGWEEVDRVVRAGNYGWNILEGDECFRAAACDRSGTLAPRAQYSHEFGCSVTGGYVYRGTAMPELVGWYVYGDYCSGRVWAVDAASDAGAAIPIADTGLPISSFGQDVSGELYIVSFDGGLHRLQRKAP